MFSFFSKQRKRPTPDVEWVENGVANVYFAGRMFHLVQLPSTEWELTHPDIVPVVFPGGYSTALAYVQGLF